MASDNNVTAAKPRKKRRGLKITILSIIGLIVVLLVVAFILRAPLIRWAANKYLPLVEAQSGVGIKFSRLEISTFGRVTLYDCRMTLQKRLFLKVKKVSFRPRILPLFSQEIVIKGVYLEHPEVFLDALDLMAKKPVPPPPVKRGPPPAKPWKLVIHGLRVTNGTVTWTRLPVPTPWTSAKNVNVRADFAWVFSPDKPDIMLDSAKTSLRLDPGGFTITNLSGRVHLTPTGIELNKVSIQTTDSSIRANGTIQDWAKMNIDLTAGPIKVKAADLARFGITLPDRFARAPILLTAKAKGPRAKVKFEINASQSGIKLAASGVGNFSRLLKPVVQLEGRVTGLPWVWLLRQLAPKKVPANAAGPRPAKDLRIKAWVEADLKDFKNPGYKVRLTIQDVPLRWIIARLGPPEALQAVPAPRYTFVRIKAEGRGFKPPAMTVKGNVQVSPHLLKAEGDLVKKLITIRRAAIHLGWGSFFIKNGRIIDLKRLRIVISGTVRKVPPIRELRRTATVLNAINPGVPVPVTVILGGTINKPKVEKVRVKAPRIRIEGPGRTIRGLLHRLPGIR